MAPGLGYNDLRVSQFHCGQRHPAALGNRLLKILDDTRDVVEPTIVRVHGGESILMDDLALILHEHGIRREAHFAFSFTPLRDETGKVLGFSALAPKRPTMWF